MLREIPAASNGRNNSRHESRKARWLSSTFPLFNEPFIIAPATFYI